MRQGPGFFGGGAPMRSMGHSPFQMNPMMGMGQPARQGGGLLAKLFGRGSGMGMQNFGGAAANAAARTSGSGGLLQSLTNPGTINGFLNNTQQILKTAQQVGPMIQQYGPLVKNLPAMWKLYRGFKDMPDSTDNDDEEKAKTKTSAAKQNHSSRIETESSTTESEEPRSESTQVPKRIKGESTPKLFI
ncbi:hypothetical protein GNT69_08395 [Bacillus sp. B15-48]|nr:hypothetical protein [Bacillus sp. B15-48]